jgi:transcription-repair coupling factor (superfamily II helicase)
MTKAELKELYVSAPKVQEVVERLKNHPQSHIALKKAIGSLASFYAYGIAQNFPINHLFILSDKEEAAYFLNDLEELVGEEKAIFFPGSYRKAYDVEKTDNANIQMRAEALNKINKKDGSYLIVTYPEAITEKVVTKKNLEQNTLLIRRNDKLSIDFLIDILNSYSFNRVDFAAEPGDFSIRGGIVDIYSFSNENPIRIELFGDEVDSIRTFEPGTQLSISPMEFVSILPNVQEKLLEESRESFLEFLPKNTILWFKDYLLTKEKIHKEFENASNVYTNIDSPIKHLPPFELFTSKDEFILESKKFNTIEFGTADYFDIDLTVTVNADAQPAFNKNFDLLSENLNRNTERGIENIILASTAKQIERLYAIFEDIGKEIHMKTMLMSVQEGFVDNDLKIACYTDHQIFNRYHRFRLKESFRKKDQAITLKELNSLQTGDYITHIDHGVGQFSGLEKIDVNGKKQEAIRILYKSGDILYVSIHSLHRISKFVGKDGTPPKVDKLGATSWAKQKQKTKNKIKEVAFDLIKLYAERRTKEGFQFSPDTYLQDELEASFIYEDTPDQLKATNDIKADMESPQPMDRLICGDVGFGKTEVAIRAAFKAVADSKQVAILVPTTILAWQHYKTFKDRLADFPCKVDYINRFKSPKQQKETLRKLADGEVDIIIGTHRLAGKDIKFHNLGLLIIDEEQKFGVGVKDKLKTIKANVDTLTLTATPIPRTLQFSLMAARDLSVINTPPPNRQPILTEVHSFNEELIRDAIMYEVKRNGQVFFINNRVENLKEIAGMITRLCPDVKVLTAHGQLKGDDLEDRMMSFIDGDYDVLVATTIIESGLDIPNANTIIINNANNFGLSDLHQMRGRVGRSNKKAFCYLLAPPIVALSNDARRRLQALEQFSDLGSGFQIAMKDLDIRGAGNLLGAEQSGFISEIGFEMYKKILDEAIQELKENEFKDLYHDENESEYEFVKDTIIETDFELLIPDQYITNISERINLYKELDSIETEEALVAFENQLLDRFGKVPKQTKELIETIRLRWLAQEVGFEKLILKQGKFIGYFLTNEESPYYQSAAFTRVLNYVQKNQGTVALREKNKRLSLVFTNVKSIPSAIAAIEKLLVDKKAAVIS